MRSILFESIYPEGLFAIAPSPTVIIDQRWEDVPSTEKALLEKILTAIKHSLNSVTILQQNTLDLSVLAVSPKQVIYFGKPANGIPLYEFIEANGVRIVAAESLKTLSENEDARKKLWQSLKKQFSI